MVNGIVLENRTYSNLQGSDLCRLAMMEMRVTLSRLIWNYDISLKSVGQEVPTYEHRAVASGPLEVRLKRVERSQS